MTAPLYFKYDAQLDVLTIDGIAYSGELFRQFAIAPPGTFLEIVARADSILTVRIVRDPRPTDIVDAKIAIAGLQLAFRQLLDLWDGEHIRNRVMQDAFDAVRARLPRRPQ